MLIIRREQMHVLEQHAQEPYVEQLVGEVRVHFPERFEAMTERGVRAFVMRVIAHARAHGVDTQTTVPVLIQLMLEFGEAFERSPDKAWAESMLAHPSLPAQVKVELLRERMTGRPAVPFAG